MYVCPVCGNEYDGYPAVSRKDNRTEICPNCGVREALSAAGITGEKADEIVFEIEKHQKKSKFVAE